MKYGVGVGLCLAAMLSPVFADPASEAYLTDRIATLDANPNWRAEAASVGSEGAETVVTDVTVEMASPKTTLTADEVRIENLVPGEDDGFSFTGGTIENLEVAAPSLEMVVPNTEPGQAAETLSIALIEVGGIEFLDPEGFGAISKLAPDADPATRDLAMQEALGSLPKLGHFVLNDLTLGNADPLTMKSFTVDVEGYLGPFPLPWKAEMTDLTLPGLYVRSALKHIDPRLAQIVKLLDDQVFVVDAAGGESWADADNGEVRANARATINDAAVIDLTYSYTGVNEAWLASVTGEAVLGDFRKAMEAFESGVQLKNMTLRISDTALLDEIFAAVATELGLGIDGPTYRKQISYLALPLFMLALGRPELSEDFLQPLQEFVGDGKTLVIQLQPAEPVSAAQIAEAMNGDPEKLMTLLNLTMTTEDSAALQ